MPNRLSKETSPYLLQHASNPVDWFPWGEEAFAEAHARDVPILLSIGYSACHWCHVMAHESFEDPAVADQMNRAFVCVKVDREERPDIDRLYQGVVQLMGKGGGWPLTVFLLPDRRPFFGGTYFPPEDRFGLPGFKRLLHNAAESWSARRGDVIDSAESFAQGLHEWLRADLAGAPARFSEKELGRVGDWMVQALDPTHGGFGGAPKFPNPLSLLALLRCGRHGATRASVEGTLFTLDRMAEGGLYDQLGGGFHRYTVDAAWTAPHFEKMLYDNALLIRLYTEAWQIAQRPRHARVVEETIGWLTREMTSPEGGFFAARDADSEGEEGRFFVFTPSEIEAAVGPDRAANACRIFGVTPEGNFEGGRSVLSRRGEDAEAETLRAALFAWRERRTPPGLDHNLLAGWNGLAIGAVACAARVFDRPEWTALARRAAANILDTLFDGERLLRTPSGLPGLLEDYGNLSQGLVELFMATQEPRWLEAAARLARMALRGAWDEEACAFRAALGDTPPLVATVFATHDEAWPSGASTLVDALLRLGAITSDPTLVAAAESYLMRMCDAMLSQPFSYGQLLCAADTWLDGASTLALVGDTDGALRREAAQRWTPSLSVVVASGDAPHAPHPLLEEVFRDKATRDGRPTAYLCRRFTCAEPRHTVGEALADTR